MTGGRDMSARVVPRQSERSALLLERLTSAGTLVLDGATGTELERRGIQCGMPLWSAHALISDPDEVFDIHRRYKLAGADLLTANTFRTQRRALAQTGRGDEAAQLTSSAVMLARRAADHATNPKRDVFVLGSAPPLEDCYRPDRVPDAAALAQEHDEHAANLWAAGVDAILVETMNTIREARVAATAASRTGLPTLVSFVCGDGARLLSGEPLADAIRAVSAARPACVLVNCVPPSQILACVDVLRDVAPCFGVYANLGEPVSGARRSEDRSPSQFAALAQEWMRAGAKIVGGCCGTTPAHIAALVSSAR